MPGKIASYCDLGRKVGITHHRNMFIAILLVIPYMCLNKAPIRCVIVIEQYHDISTCSSNAVVSRDGTALILTMTNVNQVGH